MTPSEIPPKSKGFDEIVLWIVVGLFLVLGIAWATYPRIYLHDHPGLAWPVIPQRWREYADSSPTWVYFFRRICEAYLVEHIIEKAGGVNYDDETYYIGLTIYRRGIERAVPADELKAKADAILALLEESGRIYLDAERVLRVKSARNRALAAAG